ncbi:Golgin subfamily A member 7/ERF4 family-domain-containing protein [Xylariaceae sp. FL1019]|nr:Golgin subfamily A member 7/ERF4 family-domain-containing protein [Xylariaceae sp. FL1019]
MPLAQPVDVLQLGLAASIPAISARITSTNLYLLSPLGALFTLRATANANGNGNDDDDDHNPNFTRCNQHRIPHNSTSRRLCLGETNASNRLRCLDPITNTSSTSSSTFVTSPASPTNIISPTLDRKTTNIHVSALEAHTLKPTPTGQHVQPLKPALLNTFASPFRTRAAAKKDDKLPRIISQPGRLWNPTNSTPRPPPVAATRCAPKSQIRRLSTPPPPPIPIPHPTLQVTSVPDDSDFAGPGDIPLLSLAEQRQTRHLDSARASLQIEGQLSEDKKVCLPPSVRHSYDNQRPSDPSEDEHLRAAQLPSDLPSKKPIVTGFRKRGQGVTDRDRARAVSFGLVRPEPPEQAVTQSGKGKEKAAMTQPSNADPSRGFSHDLERGPDALGHQPNRSTLSLPGDIGSTISSNSSIVGDPDQPGLGEEWGPSHPCFPHLNPHVPVSSNEYKTTRIIRIRRDWLVAGDLGPAFSNMYPEILDPAGVSEQEFRRVIEKLNGTLLPIFNPYHWRNILDGVLGVLSGWVWEDFGLTNAKTSLNALEMWIEQWNAEMEKTTGPDALSPKIISLRRTGYMNLDFQIPDPEVSISNSEPASRSGPPIEPIEPITPDGAQAAP